MDCIKCRVMAAGKRSVYVIELTWHQKDYLLERVADPVFFEAEFSKIMQHHL